MSRKNQLIPPKANRSSEQSTICHNCKLVDFSDANAKQFRRVKQNTGQTRQNSSKEDDFALWHQRMSLKDVMREKLGYNPKAYIQETVERIDKIIEALNSPELSGAEKSSVQQYKEKLSAHTRKTLYELIAIM